MAASAAGQDPYEREFYWSYGVGCAPIIGVHNYNEPYPEGAPANCTVRSILSWSCGMGEPDQDNEKAHAWLIAGSDWRTNSVEEDDVRKYTLQSPQTVWHYHVDLDVPGVIEAAHSDWQSGSGMFFHYINHNASAWGLKETPTE